MKKSQSNDTIILQLKEQIEEKKKALKSSEKFSPITNCSIELDNNRMNIHALNKEQLVILLVRLNSYRLSAIDLGLAEDLKISGHELSDWMTDINAKLMNLNRKAEEERLQELEIQLHGLLSIDKKVELAIDVIKKSL